MFMTLKLPTCFHPTRDHIGEYICNTLYSIIWYFFSDELPLTETCRNAQSYEQISKNLCILVIECYELDEILPA